MESLTRHHSGDWGTLSREDWLANQSAPHHGTRLFSDYYTETYLKFWIITEADRSVTTVLLPEDY